MQTFLPSSNFAYSARILDNKRLGKQRVEAKQILLALVNGTSGWRNHPATKMWSGYEAALCNYAIAICDEWISRGFKDSLRNWFVEQRMTFGPPILPFWLCDSAFHESHRSNLLRKDPVYYGQFGWKVPNDLPYVWPV